MQTRKMPNVSVLGENVTLMHPVYKKELQIIGQIGEPGQRDKLNFTSLDRQIHRTCKRGYDEGEIVEAVIEAIIPGVSLRSYLESRTDLTLPALKQINKINQKKWLIRYINHLYLRSLHDGNPIKSLVQSSLSSSVTTPVTMALIIARSLANKTFILNDPFASHKLDFLFITEIWLKAGDMSSLSELSSTGGCSFFSTPRSIGQGGGHCSSF